MNIKTLSELTRRAAVPAWLLVMAAVMLPGCGGSNPLSPKPQTDAVPYPVSLLLPTAIDIHSFTGTKTFEDGTQGIEVHIVARDAYGDATKAFGDFRFELFTFRPNSPDPKGRLVDHWSNSLLKPEDNASHWWKVSRTYIFKLQSRQPLKAGQQYVLVAYFSSPYTPRWTKEKVFVAGQ